MTAHHACCTYINLMTHAAPVSPAGLVALADPFICWSNKGFRWVTDALTYCHSTSTRLHDPTINSAVILILCQKDLVVNILHLEWYSKLVRRGNSTQEQWQAVRPTTPPSGTTREDKVKVNKYIVEEYQSETDSDYTSYWRDWVCPPKATPAYKQQTTTLDILNLFSKRKDEPEG